LRRPVKAGMWFSCDASLPTPDENSMRGRGPGVRRDDGVLAGAGKTTVIPAQAGIQKRNRKAGTRIFIHSDS
jgi:hypothetical protein